MKKLLLVSVLFILMINVSGQFSNFVLTFTAINNSEYVQLDSIMIMNRTQGGDTVLYWPDTANIIVGIEEIQDNHSLFQVFQNYPNPVLDQTTISLYVPERDEVDIMITDMLGRVLLKDERVLDLGTHSFRFKPGEGKLYFFTAQWRGNSSSIKILCSSSCSEGTGILEYSGSENSRSQLKTAETVQGFPFNVGDTLLYIGYANSLQSGMLDAPETSEIYTFQFATNIPCPGTPTVTYEGQVYNTIQVFSQCWLKENLNVGIMITGSQYQTNNGTIEKYCYDNDTNNCAIYGGLYQWNETMQYTIQQGAQGICPQGWHLPTDEEWKVLEGAVDSQYGIGDNTWDISGIRGYDVGTNLKTTSGWYANGNGTDLYGFSGLPGGRRDGDASFVYMGEFGFKWSSTLDNNLYSWFRGLSNQGPENSRGRWSKMNGFSVRCIKDQ